MMKRITRIIRPIICMAVLLFALTTAVMGCYQKEAGPIDIPGRTPSGTSAPQPSATPAGEVILTYKEEDITMKYSNEEKLSIVARCQQGESIAALSNELAIPRSTLYRWIKSFPMDSAGKPLKFSYQEYTLLQRKVEKLQNIITILKSADCLVSAPLKERLHALEAF